MTFYIVLQKLDRRRRSLAAVDWPQEKKDKILRVLTIDNMSSEEDDPERPRTFIVRPKPNESKKFSKYKKRLDRMADKVDGKRAKGQRNERERGALSNKPLVTPDSETDSWAIKTDEESEEAEDASTTQEVSQSPQEGEREMETDS